MAESRSSALPKVRAPEQSEERDLFLDEVLPDELDYVRSRRELVASRRDESDGRELVAHGPATENSLVGLAFSGGGARSATFHLGVAQELHQRGVLDHVDYLSTSGGGSYIGGSIVALMSEGGEFPYTTDSPYLNRLRNRSDYWAGRGLLDSLVEMITRFRAIALNLLIVVPILLLAAVFVDLWFGGPPGWASRGVLTVWEEQHQSGDPISWWKAYWLSPLALGSSLLWLAIYPMAMGAFTSQSKQRAPASRRRTIELTGARLLLALLFLGTIETLPLLLHFFSHLRTEAPAARSAIIITAVSLSVVTLIGFGPAMTPKRGKWRSVLVTLALPAGLLLPLFVTLYAAEGLIYDWQDLPAFHPLWFVLATVLGLLFGGGLALTVSRLPTLRMGPWRQALVVLAFLAGGLLPFVPFTGLMGGEPMSGVYAALRTLVALLAAWTVGSLFEWWLADRMQGSRRHVAVLLVALGVLTATYLLVPASRSQEGIDATLVILALALATWLFSEMTVDFNLPSGLLRLQDRIATAYLPSVPSAGSTPGEDSIESNGEIALTQLHQNGRTTAPYLLINVAQNLLGSRELSRALRDFFVISGRHLGGSRSGYCSTDQLQAVFPQLHLATAAAISAAAAAPDLSTTYSRALAAVYGFFNVRLGHWIPNPTRLMRWAARFATPHRSTLWRRFVWRVPPKVFFNQIMAKFTERDRWVSITDGGLMDNLGIYELLRRRCKYIIAGDASLDPEMNFRDLANLLRFAATDLGIEIDIALDGVRRDPEKGDLSRSHVAVGRISYPLRDADSEPETGLLFYLKACVNGDEDEVVAAYRLRHSAFPHEENTQNACTPEQFDVYRELGCHAVRSLFTGLDGRQRVGFPEFEKVGGETRPRGIQ